MSKILIKNGYVVTVDRQRTVWHVHDLSLRRTEISRLLGPGSADLEKPSSRQIVFRRNGLGRHEKDFGKIVAGF